MFKIEKLTNFLLEEEKVELSLSSWVEKWKDITIENLSTVLDNQWNNDFSTAFKEIYNQYISDNYNEKNIWDKFFKKTQDTKILNQNKLEDTFDRLMKWENVESEENLDILWNLFNNTSFLKVFENFLDNNDKYPEILNKKNIKEFILNKIKLEKKRIIDDYLLNTWKVFIVDWKYYVHNNELITTTQSILDEFKYDNSLDYLEKKAHLFDDMYQINDKIVLSNKWWNFIIFDKNTENIIYESKKWESISEESLNPIIVTILKPYWLKAELNIETWEVIEEETKENKIKKGLFGLWKLVIPTYFIENNDFDWFLRSPYLWKLLKLWKHWNNIFDIADKPAFKKILLETIKENFSYFLTKIKFEDGIDWWSFFNWLEDYIEENYEKYTEICELNDWRFFFNRENHSKYLKWLMSWEFDEKNYLKLLPNKYLEIYSESSMTEKWSPVLPILNKNWYMTWKEVLTWEEFLVKLDENGEIKHIIKK